jgi:hypothetical protein
VKFDFNSLARTLVARRNVVDVPDLAPQDVDVVEAHVASLRRVGRALRIQERGVGEGGRMCVPSRDLCNDTPLERSLSFVCAHARVCVRTCVCACALVTGQQPTCARMHSAMTDSS